MFVEASKFVWFIVFFVGLTSSKIHINNPYNVSNRVARNLSGFQSINNFTAYNFIYFSKQICPDTFESYMKTLAVPRMIFQIPLDHQTTAEDGFIQETISIETWIFIDTLSAFDENLRLFVSSELFANKGNYRIVPCFPIEEESLVDLGERVWRIGILNFVFLYYSNRRVNEAQYNPFTGDLATIQVADIKQGHEEYPDKLRNMNGYPFKVLDYPSMVDSPNQLFDFDWNFKQALKTYLNATLVYRNVPLDEGHVYYLYYHMSCSDADFCANTVATSKRNVNKTYQENVDILYPHQINNLIIAVPKPRKIQQWWNIIFSLGQVSLALTVALSVLSALLDKYLARSRNADFRYFIYSILKMSSPTKSGRKTVMRFVWLLAMLFLGMLYDNAFLKLVLTNNYETELNTLADLKRTGLKIYSRLLIQRDPQGMDLSFDYEPLNISDWARRLRKNDGTAAFLGPYSDLKRFKEYFRSKHVKFAYKFLKEPVLTKFGSFLIKKKSPYLRKLEGLARRVREFGMAGTGQVKSENFDAEDFKIGFEHFLGMFIVLIIGLGVACLVFVGEIVWDRRRKGGTDDM